jgi:hypothetical protein
LRRQAFPQWPQTLRFGGVPVGASILNEIGQRAPDVGIGRILGFEAAGFFSRGNALISLFGSAFLNAVRACCQVDGRWHIGYGEAANHSEPAPYQHTSISRSKLQRFGRAWSGITSSYRH